MTTSKKKEEKTYKRYSACANCKFMNYVEYKKGSLVSDTPCPECNCKTLICAGEYEQKISQAMRFNT